MTHPGQSLTKLSYNLVLNTVSMEKPLKLTTFGLSLGPTSSAQLSHTNMGLRQFIRHCTKIACGCVCEPYYCVEPLNPEEVYCASDEKAP